MIIQGNAIYPTGTCFDDTADYMTLNEAGGDYMLVHGICTLFGGKLYAHAWLESPQKGEAMGFGIATIRGKEERVAYTSSIEEYHRYFGVVEYTQYNLVSALQMMLDEETNGPWLDKYLEKCTKEKQHAKQS